MVTQYSNPLETRPRRTPAPARQKRQAGSILMLFTMMLPVVLLPIVGLSIDETAMYIVGEKLQAAVDGAAIAAAQSLNAGETFAPQQAAAQLCGQEFIAANIPTGSGPGSGGYWGAYTLQDSVVATQVPASKVTTVTISARVYVPTLFMRMLGITAGTVSAYGQASRRSVVLVMVIDRSGSLGTELPAVQAGSTNFVNAFQGGTDMLGLVLMNGSGMVAYPPHDWQKLPGAGKYVATGPTGPDVYFNSSTVNPNMVQSIAVINKDNNGGNTGMADSLMLAYHELQTANQPSALNIIILWTDGAPNGITADFNNNSGVAGAASVVTAPTASPCKYKNGSGGTGLYPNSAANSMLGWVAQWGGYVEGSTATDGVFYSMQTATTGTVTSWVRLTNGSEGTLASAGATSCTYTTASGTGAVVKDLNIPNVDYYGNSTQGVNAAVPGTAGNNYTTTDYQQSYVWNISSQCNKGSGGEGGNPLNLTTKMTNGLYPMGDACQNGLASWNAADMAGRQIRADHTLQPVIYTMGYEGSAAAVDKALLSRLANTNGTAINPLTNKVYNTVYDTTATMGQFFDIPTANDVATAFNELLSEILRLSQ